MTPYEGKTEIEKQALVAAYKMGKCDYQYENSKRTRKDFNTDAEFTEYKMGWRYYAAEDALDRDTEWN